MPIHDWSRVDASVFHHFHTMWTSSLAEDFNRGRLGHDHYALLERTERGVEASLAGRNAIVIHRTSDHRKVAVLEIMSPKRTGNRLRLGAFVSSTEKLLRAGIHLLIVDLFPPGSLDRGGIHHAIWERLAKSDFILPSDQPLTLASYIGGPIFEAYVEPMKIGASLCDMPLFLSAGQYVSVPLEKTYLSAFEAVPPFWRKTLNSPPANEF